MRWDPTEYLTFADERGRPFRDLMARVGASAPAYVVDLGCGPGNLTVSLAQRWPGAVVEGVDSSAEMVERATADLADAPVRFSVGDLRDWVPDRPVDVLVSNATLQWVPGHLALLDRLLSWVAPGGWFGFQVPGNFDEPTHTELAALRESPRWRDRLGGNLAQPGSEQPATYLRRLAATGARVEAWETTYLQVLQGEDAVVRWMRGTGLRPVLAELDAGEQEEFLSAYRERMRAAYPPEPSGTVLPYRRVFVVAEVAGSR
ncbi:MAG: trans-aconitate 2-methyltransferase [Actinomycetota bacterium]|nr:trans-aconitate 2-methyltransferase [Actinomycetota bacterium]